jgi:hypothetical protein
MCCIVTASRGNVYRMITYHLGGNSLKANMTESRAGKPL